MRETSTQDSDRRIPAILHSGVAEADDDQSASAATFAPDQRLRFDEDDLVFHAALGLLRIC